MKEFRYLEEKKKNASINNTPKLIWPTAYFECNRRSSSQIFGWVLSTLLGAFIKNKDSKRPDMIYFQSLHIAVCILSALRWLPTSKLNKLQVFFTVFSLWISKKLKRGKQVLEDFIYQHLQGMKYGSSSQNTICSFLSYILKKKFNGLKRPKTWES